MNRSAKRQIWGARRPISVRLDSVIWEALEDVAHRRCSSVYELVTEIDRDRGSLNLASAIRGYVIAYYHMRMQAALRGNTAILPDDAGRQFGADHREISEQHPSPR
jgi:predicted DNA-binding ribbon-helix-helix protein